MHVIDLTLLRFVRTTRRYDVLNDRHCTWTRTDAFRKSPFATKVLRPSGVPGVRRRSVTRRASVDGAHVSRSRSPNPLRDSPSLQKPSLYEERFQRITPRRAGQRRLPAFERELGLAARADAGPLGAGGSAASVGGPGGWAWSGSAGGYVGKSPNNEERERGSGRGRGRRSGHKRPRSSSGVQIAGVLGAGAARSLDETLLTFVVHARSRRHAATCTMPSHRPLTHTHSDSTGTGSAGSTSSPSGAVPRRASPTRDAQRRCG